MARENKRKSLYGEKTKIVPFRVPASKESEIKNNVYEMLDGYAENMHVTFHICKQLQTASLDKCHSIALESNLKNNGDV